jgi:hypothetical protein
METKGSMSFPMVPVDVAVFHEMTIHVAVFNEMTQERTSSFYLLRA